MDTNIIIGRIVIAIVVLSLIFVFMEKKSQENFADNIKEYEFTTSRAGHGSAKCTLKNTVEEKDIS